MPRPIQIDQEQNLAIRTEVAERLRTMLSLEGRRRVPRSIRQSIDRLAELDPATNRASVIEGWPPLPLKGNAWIKLKDDFP